MVDEDWRSDFMPGRAPGQDGIVPDIEPEPVEEDEPVGEPYHVVGGPKEVSAQDLGGDKALLDAVLENQERIMMAVDNMASGFSNQLVILARRIDNFERILEQSQGQPPITNLMYDAPEVFNKVVQREEVEEEEDEDEEVAPLPATEPRAPNPNFEIPDEVEHLLNFDANFPVSIEIQVAYHMWKEGHDSFQSFVKISGGPKKAKEMRSHLE